MKKSIMIRTTDDIFPDKLKEINNPPEQLYCRGNLDLLNEPSIAVVGSRKCTQYGVTVASAIGRRAAECGVTVVSGLAEGIDAAAHRGTLGAQGHTIAVFANGTDICYPSVNMRLMKDILRSGGLVISEYPDGTRPRKYTFPERNRLISGLAHSVIIVEAATDRSGSLITAEYAAEQGRMLYAVPGNITAGSSFGSNKLIRDGVTPLMIIDDIFEEMNIQPASPREIIENMGEDEQAVYRAVCRSSELTTDEICRITCLPASVVNGIITVLEMKGAVVSSMGKVFINNL